MFNYFANNEKEYLVSGGGNGKISIYDIQDKWSLKQTICDSTKPIQCIEKIFCRRNKFDKLLLTGSEDGIIRIYLTSFDFVLIQNIVPEMPGASIKAFSVFEF